MRETSARMAAKPARTLGKKARTPSDRYIGIESAFSLAPAHAGTISGSVGMKLPTNELLLALRSPTSGWLATMVCALEEAVRDPDFSANHRALLTQLLAARSE